MIEKLIFALALSSPVVCFADSESRATSHEPRDTNHEPRAAAFDLGKELADAGFWKTDPALLVSRHRENGFDFTTGLHDAAASRLDGGVAFNGLPVFETRISFDPDGVSRVELALYASGGVESVETTETADGKRLRVRKNVAKTLSRDAFLQTLKDVRAALNGADDSVKSKRRDAASPGKSPKAVAARVKRPDVVQKSQTWKSTPLSGAAVLTWNYAQQGKNAATFKPGFIRLALERPGDPGAAAGKSAASPAANRDAPATAKTIALNVVRHPSGDVVVEGVPMVDQGAKGYCAAASAERVLRYYGVDVDEHEIAEAAGTTAEGGTSTRAMKDAVDAVARKYKLAAVVAYGDFEKSTAERIAGIVKEADNYNKAAKKLRKPEIGESVYVKRQGDGILYDLSALDRAMDPEVLREMKANGAQKARFAKFAKDVHAQIDKGIPLFWGVKLGVYPEPGIPQAGGYHMRLVIGYNDKRKELLYTDSWGAGHELKRMPFDWAFTCSQCLLYVKPLK